jgi:hypothetical protein
LLFCVVVIIRESVVRQSKTKTNADERRTH